MFQIGLDKVGSKNLGRVVSISRERPRVSSNVKGRGIKGGRDVVITRDDEDGTKKLLRSGAYCRLSREKKEKLVHFPMKKLIGKCDVGVLVFRGKETYRTKKG